MANRKLPPSVLSIAGSDSGGGAGIQADLKTFAAHGVHGLSAIAALTAQNTQGVSAVHVPPLPFLRAQLDAVFTDFDIRAVKIGMLANAEVIACVAKSLKKHAARNIVLDPVMVASSGARLLDPAALGALCEQLLPMADLITPNIPEAELLLDHRIADDDAADAATVELLALGAKAVLLKGGHLPGKIMRDRFDDGRRFAEFEHRKLPREGHGTGCTLSSAIAANLAKGLPLLDACAEATDYVHEALKHAYRPGRGGLYVLAHIRP